MKGSIDAYELVGWRRRSGVSFDGPVYAAETGTDNAGTSTNNGDTMTRYAQVSPPSTAITLPGAGQGNDASQGRYYDDDDRWLDPHTGLPIPGAPQTRDSGNF